MIANELQKIKLKSYCHFNCNFIATRVSLIQLSVSNLIQLTILATIQCYAHTSPLSNVLFGMNAYEMCPRVIQSYVCAVDVSVGPKLRETKICIIEQN